MAEPDRQWGATLCVCCGTYTRTLLIDGVCWICRYPRPAKTAA